ncbi:helix-turn-helix domain-containing protein [Goodfellowiella coeruleoviolacea]|uniref:Helix-turn-helix domain-containing protein n=1 Tax=Goodfellowiella coeruleoviolacea TaxID=334858 RepID=A0AAE3KEF6_9PSEU|nr:helix-turn-helix domain-containing protein [Goodfellowiella coeruleoviolacea]MCP2163852.1 Helix-turn-helix domain-containing protein [Goodfellowiella coeruleoviolacea]
MSTPPALTGLRALAHPVRLRILSLLTGTAMSAADVARELGANQANISYHLRQLHKVGLVDVVDQVRIRGGLAKRYRHDPDSGPLPRPSDRQDHLLFASAMAEELRRRSGQRLLDAPASTTDAELWLPAEQWRELVAKANELGELLHRAAQPPGSPGAVRTSATIALFTMAPTGQRATGETDGGSA